MINEENPKFVRGQSKDTDGKEKLWMMKERLFKYRDLNREIDNEIERLEALERRASSPSSPSMSSMPKSPSPIKDRMADTISMIVDLQNELKVLIEQRDAERCNIEALVKKLKKADERAVIRMRYINLEEWEDIQMMLFGFHEDYLNRYDNYKQRMFRLHNSAIVNLSLICE